MSAPALVADLDVKLPIAPEEDLAAVVVPAHRLVRIRLERAQHDDVLVERQRLGSGVPEVAIDAIAQDGDVGQVGAVGAGAALGPVEVHAVGVGEVGLKRDTEQPALGGGIDGQVQRRAGHGAVDHVLHLPAGLFQNQEIVGSEECHAGGLIEAGDHGADVEARVGHLGSLGRRKRGWIDGERAEEAVLLVVGSGGEEERVGERAAGRRSGQTQAELEPPDARDADRFAGGIADSAEERAGIEVESVDRSVAEVSDEQRVVEIAEALKGCPGHPPR